MRGELEPQEQNGRREAPVFIWLVIPAKAGTQ